MDTVELLAAVLAGDRAAAASLGALDAGEVCDAALHHGVLPLVADHVSPHTASTGGTWEALGREASRHAVADVVREVELVRLLNDFARAGIRALVFKGAELAYSHYRRPDLRPRVDTDLLIAVADRARAHERLIDLGYDAPGQVTGDFVNHQSFYVKRQNRAETHVVDLHWRIANPQVFSDVLGFEEVSASAVPLPSLATSALGLAPAHALFVACVHRVAHHFDSDRLIWLYDIHLVAQDLSDAEWKTFVGLAVERKVVRICRQGLERTASRFKTAFPEFVLAELRPDDAGVEPSAAYLSQDRRLVENFLSDLRALPGWGSRLRLVREHLFPSSHYMRGVYAPASRAPLALLYAERALKGARRWLART